MSLSLREVDGLPGSGNRSPTQPPNPQTPQYPWHPPTFSLILYPDGYVDSRKFPAPNTPVQRVSADAESKRGLRVRRGSEQPAAAAQQPRPKPQKSEQAASDKPRRPRAAAQKQPAVPERDRFLRLFFAVELPAPLASELVAAQQKLSQNWRRVEAQQLHITLAYLPGVPQSRVAELRALGQTLAGSVPPLALRLRGTGYHPNVGSPRVWFVKAEGEGLLELAARFQAEVEALGFATEGAFQPHITLARKKGPAPRVPPLTFALGWTAPQFSLIHTFLPRDKTGPVYDTVSRFAFTGQPPAESASTEATTNEVSNNAAPDNAAPIPEEHHGHR